MVTLQPDEPAAEEGGEEPTAEEGGEEGAGQGPGHGVLSSTALRQAL